MANFTDEKNTLMLIQLLKEHGIKKIIANPGTTNVAFVASVQQDDFFEIYSAYDERSAAYMACGMAAESGEPVVLSCTQATASRNYFPGLTEAYYRNLPILAVTSTQHWGRIGQNFQQAIDRTVQPVDTIKLSVQVPVIHTEDDDWYCNVLLNRALLEVRRNGGSPVHINLTTTYSREFPVTTLPTQRVIRRYTYHDLVTSKLPSISKNEKIAVFVGSHVKWNEKLTNAVDEFCAAYNAVVLCDQSSNYKGDYRVLPNILVNQTERSSLCNIDHIIHIGDVSGAALGYKVKQVWRVNPDGEVRDTFKKVVGVFEMEEIDFFTHYANKGNDGVKKSSYLEAWVAECDRLLEKIPELPLSNAWLAQNTIDKLPDNSILHLGIYNSLRNWSFFELPHKVLSYSNTGGFGIDGCLSSVLGASLATDKIVFCVLGDLAFFYDMNTLCNRHISSNIRILLVNNGLGTEFKNHDNRAFGLGDLANPYISCEGHNGRKSEELVKQLATALGFKYISASTKEEYLKKVKEFISPEKQDRPIVFEVFTKTEDETEALRSLYNLDTTMKTAMKSSAKNVVRSVIGKDGVKTLKNILGR